MVWVYCQRSLEIGDSILAPSPGLQEVTPIAVGYRVIRIDPDSFTVVGNGAVVIPLACTALPRLLWASAKLGLILRAS